jgi:ribosomal protein L37E
VNQVSFCITRIKIEWSTIRKSNVLMAGLTRDCLVHIFGYLGGYQDIVNSSLVNQNWNEAAEDQHVWEVMLSRRFGESQGPTPAKPSAPSKGKKRKNARKVLPQRADRAAQLTGSAAYRHVIKNGCYTCGFETKTMKTFSYQKEVKPDVKLCSSCAKGNVIYTTDVKKKYKLTEEEIQKLPVITKDNSHHELAVPIRMFIRRMVEEARDQIVARKNQEKEAAAKVKRRDSLATTLGKRGLELRDDSEMCKRYIEEGSITINEVVEELKEKYGSQEPPKKRARIARRSSKKSREDLVDFKDE